MYSSNLFGVLFLDEHIISDEGSQKCHMKNRLQQSNRHDIQLLCKRRIIHTLYKLLVFRTQLLFPVAKSSLKKAYLLSFDKNKNPGNLEFPGFFGIDATRFHAS